MGFAKGVLIGNVGAAPDVRAIASGDKVTTFSVAVNEWRGKTDSRQQVATWYRVTAWGKLGEICATMQKGAKVYVEGRLSVRSYTDRSGEKRDSVEITAEKIEFLSPRSQETHPNPGQTHAGDTLEYHGPDGSDDIPF